MSEYSPFRVVSRHADEAARYRINSEEEIAIKVSSKETGGAYCVIEHRGGLQVAPPVHLHRKADEIFEVLEGRVGFWLGGQVIEAKPGMTIAIPKNMPHTWRNLGKTETRMVVTFIPGGTDGFFEAAEGIPHSDPRAAILAEQFDTVYVDAPVDARLWDAASSEPVPVAADQE